MGCVNNRKCNALLGRRDLEILQWLNTNRKEVKGQGEEMGGGRAKKGITPGVPSWGVFISIIMVNVNGPWAPLGTLNPGDRCCLK